MRGENRIKSGVHPKIHSLSHHLPPHTHNVYNFIMFSKRGSKSSTASHEIKILTDFLCQFVSTDKLRFSFICQA